MYFLIAIGIRHMSIGHKCMMLPNSIGHWANEYGVKMQRGNMILLKSTLQCHDGVEQTQNIKALEV